MEPGASEAFFVSHLSAQKTRVVVGLRTSGLQIRRLFANGRCLRQSPSELTSLHGVCVYRGGDAVQDSPYAKSSIEADASSPYRPMSAINLGHGEWR